MKGKMGGRLLGGGGISEVELLVFFHVSFRGNGNISSQRNGSNKRKIAWSVPEMRPGLKSGGVPAEVADGWKNGVIRFRIILPLES